MTLPKSLIGWGGAGIPQLGADLAAAAQQQNLSVAGAAANTAIPVPGLVTGQQLINTVALDSTGKPLSPQPVFTVAYGANGAESSISSSTSTANGTVRVTYGPGTTSNTTYSSAIGKGDVRNNAVPAPVATNPTGYGADLGAVEADAVPEPAAVQPLVAGFTSVVSHESVTFTDSTNYGGAAAFEYTWDFGDEVGVSNAANPTYVYAQPGTYLVKLNITDSTGRQDSYAANVTSVP